jgi:uncharacterized membrane protein YdfJ with MMPL/SSD domain
VWTPWWAKDRPVRLTESPPGELAGNEFAASSEHGPSVTRLGRLVLGHRHGVLAVSLVLAAVAGMFGLFGLDRLSYGGELQAGAESARAADEVRERVPDGGTDLLLSFRDPVRTVDDPGFRGEVFAALAAVPAGLLTHTRTYFDGDAPVLRSRDGHTTLVAASLRGRDDTERTTTYRAVRDALPAGPFALTFSGPIAVREAVVSTAQNDLRRTELLSFPAVFLLLLLTFRGVAAALVPVVVGGLTMAVTLGLVRAFAAVTPISVLAVNVVTLVCLAYAVDAGLFMVGRFREELATGRDVDTALAATMATAGRTCVYSCVTIAVVTGAMMLFGTGLTMSIGLCAALSMAVSALISLTLLPALLGVLGRRIDWLSLPRPVRRAGAMDRFWGRIGRAVIAEPVGYLVAVVGVLAILSAPFPHARLGFPDQRALPADAPARAATEQLRADFAVPLLDLVQVVTRYAEPVATPAGQAAAGQWLQQLSRLPGVRFAAGAAAEGRHSVVFVQAAAAESAVTVDVVRAIRALPPPPGAEVLVGGAAAMAVDAYDLIGDRLPWVLGVIAVLAYLLLAVLLRSLVLPLKALVVNALSLGASFGVLTWMFQDGHLTWLVGATPSGYLDVLLPSLLLVLLIGLSMDYEFFLLARIREHYDATGDNDAAIVAGLQRSAPVFTGAALVVIVIGAVFATSEVVFIKQLCVGLIVAVTIDATLVRAVLVPATMRLLGKANWWLPGWMSTRGGTGGSRAETTRSELTAGRAGRSAQ